MASFVTHLEAAIDGTRLPHDRPQTLHAGRPLLVRYDLDAVGAALTREEMESRPTGFWRWRELLPVEREENRISLGETDTPIVPFAVVGSEEQAPSIANLEGFGRLFGMPAFPITMTWPWLGPLGMIPLPARYHIEFSEPMHFSGAANDEDDVIEEKVQQVKDVIQDMLRRGLAERESIFF